MSHSLFVNSITGSYSNLRVGSGVKVSCIACLQSLTRSYTHVVSY